MLGLHGMSNYCDCGTLLRIIYTNNWELFKLVTKWIVNYSKRIIIWTYFSSIHIILYHSIEYHIVDKKYMFHRTIASVSPNNILRGFGKRRHGMYSSGETEAY